MRECPACHIPLDESEAQEWRERYWACKEALEQTTRELMELRSQLTKK